MLSKRSQTQKAKYDSIYFYYILEKAKQICSCQVLRMEGVSLTLKE